MLLSDERDEILKEIKKLAEQLGGEYLHQKAINTKGESVKRIMITYDNEID